MGNRSRDIDNMANIWLVAVSLFVSQVNFGQGKPVCSMEYVTVWEEVEQELVDKVVCETEFREIARKLWRRCAKRSLLVRWRRGWCVRTVSQPSVARKSSWLIRHPLLMSAIRL